MRQRLAALPDDPRAILRLCSVVLALGALSRAVSYAMRPPEVTVSPAASVIESGIGYDRWPYILVTTTALILLGLLRGLWVLRFAGHLLGAFCCLIFSLSIIAAAFSDGASWAGAGPLVVLVLLHGALVLWVGAVRGRS